MINDFVLNVIIYIYKYFLLILKFYMSDQEFDPSDFAFLYFAISIIIVAMLPLTYSLIK